MLPVGCLMFIFLMLDGTTCVDAVSHVIKTYNRNRGSGGQESA